MFANKWLTKHHPSGFGQTYLEVTFKLILTQREYVDRSYCVVATNHMKDGG